MFEDDIFKLLLIVLLLANESGDNSRETFGRLNEIIIICLLMGACNAQRRECGCGGRCGENCACRDNHNRQTSF